MFDRKKYMKEYHKKHYAENKEKYIQQAKKFALANPKLAYEYKNRRRIQAIEYYSDGTNRCACCGESIFEFLTIDHINGGGTAFRRKAASGRSIYKWLHSHNYPEGFRVLCYNCNCAKGHYGTCPHEK